MLVYLKHLHKISKEPVRGMSPLKVQAFEPHKLASAY